MGTLISPSRFETEMGKEEESVLPLGSRSQGGKKMGAETEAERGRQNSAGSLQAHAKITMSIYGAAGGQSCERQGFPSSVLCMRYPESSSP